MRPKTITVSAVFNDGNRSRPWVFTTRTGDGVVHHRDADRKRADGRRSALVERLGQQGHTVVEPVRCPG